MGSEVKTSLNPEQQEVVAHHRGPMRVGAVAGAGKTTALIERVAYLINKRKVQPDKILMISFSRAAKDEMVRRIEKRLPAARAGKCVSTFHSIGLRIFQKEGDPKKEFALDTSGIMWLKATERAYKAMAIEPEKKGILRFSGLVKNNLLGTDMVLRRLGRTDPRMMKFARECSAETAVSAPEMIQAFHRAEHLRMKDGIEHRGQRVRFVTFDDMIYQSAMLLKRKDIRERWAERWHYVLQDEAQDECEAQSAIAAALCSKHRNYMIVGDPSQSIFGWRGSAPEKMLRFEEEWPGAKTVVMFRNYRSGIEIVDLANRIMESMPATTVITDAYGDAAMMKSERQTHAFVGCHSFEDSLAEAEAVAQNVQSHRKDGVYYRNQAVLVRMNRMTRDIEVALASRSIPYRLMSGQSFFLMQEAKVLFGYLRVMTNRADREAFKACVMHPSRRLGNAFVAKVTEVHDLVARDWVASTSRAMSELGSYQQRQAREWIAFIKTHRSAASSLPPAAMLTKLRRILRLDEYFKRNLEDEEDNRSSENMNSIIEFSESFDTVKEILDVVENVERHRAANARKQEAVVISTVHKSKGAEWQVVYLIQAAGGWFPIDMADIHEERRCFYVACTRAMDELWISRPRQKEKSDGTKVRLGPSKFVIEAGLSEEHEEKYRKGKAIEPMRVGTQVGLPL